ncbi:MAG: hypothetical protein LBM71_06200 [Elusimicrobiota bacterium]|jgi:hypothetical protein|nr:hypothetical protein [Elusimicrobiota bacterium]
MKYFVILFTVVALSIGGYVISTNKAQEGFSLAGKVEVAGRLLKPAQSNNMSCAIIAKNEADVPIAIKRIVNPKFPLDFNMDRGDLLIDSYEGNIKLEVQISSHGSLGVLKSGDIFGGANNMYASGQKNILLVADKTMGKPTLVGGKNRRNFFRTAAR